MFHDPEGGSAVFIFLPRETDYGGGAPRPSRGPLRESAREPLRLEAGVDSSRRGVPDKVDKDMGDREYHRNAIVRIKIENPVVSFTCEEPKSRAKKLLKPTVSRAFVFDRLVGRNAVHLVSFVLVSTSLCTPTGAVGTSRVYG